MKITKLDQKGIDFICSFEGFSSTPYRDSVGIPTIGYGTIRYPNGKKVTMQDEAITIEQAKVFMKHDVERFELAVDAMCPDDLTQNMFNALVSFCYNLGENSLRTSTLLKKLKQNTHDASISAEFKKWNMAGGHVVDGLVRRRGAEARLYFS